VRLQQLPPDPERAVEPALSPGGEGRQMLPLALGRLRRARFGRPQGRGDLGLERRVRGAEQQVPLEAMPEREIRVGGEHLPDQRHRVGVELQVMLDGAVEQCRGFRAVGRERQAALVTDHPKVLRARAWQYAAGIAGAATSTRALRRTK